MTIGDVELGWTEIGFTDRTATGITNAFNAWVVSADGATETLVEIDAFVGSGTKESTRTGLGDVEIGLINIGFENVQSTVDIVSQLRYSRFGWIGDPDDTEMPNVQYDPRLGQDARLTRSIPIRPENTRQRARDQGRIVLQNQDGALDSLIDGAAIDSRRVRLKVGPRGASYSTFRTIADLVGTGWAGGAETVEARVRDRGFLLSTNLQTTLYAGTGDDEGDSSVSGQPKPLIFGKVRNVTAILIDSTNLIYQIHDGSLSDITAVYEGGLAITDSGTDVSGYANLKAQSVAGGEFATATDVGMFKLGSSPSAQVTADATGHDTAIDDIVLNIMRNYAVEQESRIDVAGIVSFGAVRPGIVGTFVDPNEQPSIGRVLERLVGGAGGVVGYGSNGIFTINRLRNPDTDKAILFLDQTNTLRVRPGEKIVPRFRQRVGYKRNWTVTEDPLEAVSSGRKQFLANSQSLTTKTDTSIRDRHPDAADPEPVVSPFDAESDAATVRDDLFDLHSVERQTAEVEVWRIGYKAQLGQVVQVPWPRETSSRVKTMVVVGIEPRGPRVRLRVWG